MESCSGLNHVPGKGHGRHAQLKRMIKVCIYNPVSGSGPYCSSRDEAALRPAQNGLPACGISFPAVSYSPSAEENINISPCFSAPGSKPREQSTTGIYIIAFVRP